MTKHTCHAIGCEEVVPPSKLMCYPHWRKVPGNIRKAVHREYRPGQEKDKKPSHEYILVASAAVVAVALKEGRNVEVLSGDQISVSPSPVTSVAGRNESSGEEEQHNE